MEITFTKMHGLGNDFILIDCRNGEFHGPADFAMRYCDRRFGIGADQLLLLCPSESADFRMEIFNADGGEVEMCGNGIRCLAKYIWDRGLSMKETLEIETLAGLIRPERRGELIRVDMGEPAFRAEKIPVNVKQESGAGSGKPEGEKEKQQDRTPIIDYPLTVGGSEFRITCVSMGNPHAVIFLEEDVSGFDVARYGPHIENHSLFPKRTNVEFVNVKGTKDLVMRVWERGAGETMACGTGASAVGVAAMIKGLADRTVTVRLPGGSLIIEWAENNHVYMTGPAVEVFEGRIRSRE